MSEEEEKLPPTELIPLPPPERGAIGKPVLAKEEAVIVGLFDLDGIGAAFLASGWDLRTEVETLAGIARNDEASPADRISAARQLRRIVHEAIAANGMLSSQTAEAEQHPDGTTTLRITRRTTNLLSRIKETHDANANAGDLSHGEIYLPRTNQDSAENDQEADEGLEQGSGGMGG